MTEAELKTLVHSMADLTIDEVIEVERRLKPYAKVIDADARLKLIVQLAVLGMGVLHRMKDSGQLDQSLELFNAVRRQQPN